MNKIYYLLFLIISSSLLTSCLGDDEYEDYQLWKVENEEYFDKMKDTLDASGVKYYTEIANLPYPTYKILYHQMEPANEDGRTPFYTSTVKVNYKGWMMNGVVFDESDGAVFKVNEVIPGWTTALQCMKEGEKWRIVIPWQLAYGNSGSANYYEPEKSILPYSTLIFDVELVKITKWETGTNPDTES